jgi:hypothetical protein
MSRQNSTSTRRQFLGSVAGAAAAFTIVPRFVLGGPKFVAPSEKVYVAVVGCGGQGRTNAYGLFGEKDAQIVAIADPMDQADYSSYYYGGVAGRLPVKADVERWYSKGNPQFKCKDYVDFRQMLDKEKNIDAVLCATPDHWHAFVTLAAIHRGKHVYLRETPDAQHRGCQGLWPRRPPRRASRPRWAIRVAATTAIGSPAS